MIEVRYTADVAKKTGTSERTVQREVASGESIPNVSLLAGTSLDKPEQLGCAKPRGKKSGTGGAVGGIEPGLADTHFLTGRRDGSGAAGEPAGPIDRAQKNLTEVVRPCSGCHPGPPFS